MKNEFSISTGIEAVIFDFGNTLVEFGPKQFKEDCKDLAKSLTLLFGPCDLKNLTAIRDKQILAPYDNNFIENNLEEVCREMILELYGFDAQTAEVEALISERKRSFITCVEAPHQSVGDCLEKLKDNYRLAVLSNFPCGDCIRQGLAKADLSKFFEATVVSGEVGLVKPHPKPFQVVLNELKLKPERCLFVGDNWLADIQGAKRVGMKAFHSTEYVSYENFTPQQGDFEPDARISSLPEILGYLS